MKDERGMKIVWRGSSATGKRRHILFRYNEGRTWRRVFNWKCNFYGSFSTKIHWDIIAPFFRFTRCNGKAEIGLGNHYFQFGW